MEVSDIPEVVFDAFSISHSARQKLVKQTNSKFRLDKMVLAKISDNAKGTWSSLIRENLLINQMVIAKPVRSSDGRFVVSNWKVDIYPEGTPQRNVLDLTYIARLLNKELKLAEKPDFLRKAPFNIGSYTDIFQIADSIAFSSNPEKVLSNYQNFINQSEMSEKFLRIFRELLSLRRSIELANQITVLDLFGNTSVDSTGTSVVVDLIPYFRPANYAIACIVVDSLIWDPGTSNHLLNIPLNDNNAPKAFPEWEQLLLRAMLFKLLVFLLHPKASSEYGAHLLQAVNILRMNI